MSGSGQFFIGFKEGMKDFKYNLVTLINLALLLIVYFVGVGFASIFAKLFKRRFLETKISKEKESYWSDSDLNKKPIESYYRQF